MKILRNRKIRVRTKLKAKSTRPRLCVFVSNQHIYAQIIDDTKGITLAAAKDLDLKNTNSGKGKTVLIAREVGKLLAERAKENKILEVVFDRGERKYHGRLAAVAEGAREGGLSF